ncbi:MAG: trypsin-like peptidase domain-containing protein [Alphaproteobacteria bacterium]|nr:trypsin-like peptidase domain-containing protein [Alphaproteobacteria bacterium]
MDLRGHRILVVRRDGAGTFKVLGSGTLIAPDRVLTAKHVFSKKGKDGLHVRVDGETTYTAVRNTHHDDGNLDVAVLELDVELPIPPVPWDEGDIRAGRFQAWGFPRVSPSRKGREAVADEVAGDDKTLRKASPFGGWVFDTERSAEELAFDVNSAPESWLHASGAGLRVRDHVVAVLCGGRKHWKDRLFAVPVGHFASEDWFLKALGLGAEQRARREERARLADRLSKHLGSYEKVQALLAEQLSVDSQDVFASLVRVPVAKSMGALVECIADLREDPVANREAILRIQQAMEMLLSRVSELDGEVARCVIVKKGGGTRFVLPTQSRVVASGVMAGVDGRDCKLIWRDEAEDPRSPGFIDLPAATLGTLRPAPKILGEAVEQKLSGDPGGRIPATLVEELAVRLRVSTRGKAPERLVDEVRTALYLHAKRTRNPPPRLTLVLVDSEFDNEQQATVVWQELCLHLGPGLPDLRLLRLTGATAAVLDATVNYYVKDIIPFEDSTP